MVTTPFMKMHGLGNDFVVLDGRAHPMRIDPERARAISDRRLGVGCDQLIVVHPPRDPGAEAFMQILNADGDEVEACGNASRCVADLLMRESGRDGAVIETVYGLLPAERVEGGLVAVDMGLARARWDEIPLAGETDTDHVDIEVGPFSDGCAVNIGNPHIVFFVDDMDLIAFEEYGPLVEKHPLFPRRVNVEAVQVLARDRLRMRVWERGVGVTRACGSGACASLVAAARRGLSERKAEVILDGGPLVIEWLENGHVRMAGPVALSFTGELAPYLARDLAGALAG
jgi:diaminopimelate epimerase